MKLIDVEHLLTESNAFELVLHSNRINVQGNRKCAQINFNGLERKRKAKTNESEGNKGENRKSAREKMS